MNSCSHLAEGYCIFKGGFKNFKGTQDMPREWDLEVALTASLPLCVAAVGQHHSQTAVKAQGCTQADRAKINLCPVIAESEHNETSVSSTFIWRE